MVIAEEIFGAVREEATAAQSQEIYSSDFVLNYSTGNRGRISV